jgi:drug/metabolite transporter (DMT)-like permease
VAFAIHQLMFMMALRLTSVVDVTLMNTLAPILVAVLAVRLFGERPGLAFRAWSGLAIVGAMAVVVAGSSGPQGNPGGMALAAGNVVFYAVFLVWSKQARDHIETLPFLFGSVTVSAVVVSGYVLVSGEQPGTATARDLVLCLVVAAVPGAVGHFSMTWALRWVPANLPPVVLLVIPVLSGAMAWAFIGQHVTWTQAFGGAITLVGVLGALRVASAAGVLDREQTAAVAAEGI